MFGIINTQKANTKPNKTKQNSALELVQLNLVKYYTLKCSCWESAEWVVRWWGCHSNGQTIRTWYEKSNNMNGKMVMGEWCSNWYLPPTALKMSIESIKRIFRCFLQCVISKDILNDCDIFMEWASIVSNSLRQLLLVQMSRLFLLCERWQQRMQRQCASMYAIYLFFLDIYSPCFKPHKHRTWTVQTKFKECSSYMKATVIDANIK